jgi:thermitase
MLFTSALLALLISTPSQAISVGENPKPMVLEFAKWLSRYQNWGVEEMKTAWKLTEGDQGVVVAVIDTGIDSSHPDLKPNLWKDPSAGQNTYGWDFVSNTSNPKDEHGHGTHIAGIIGAIANKKSGTAGVAQKVSLMPIRYYSERATGKVNLANTIQALYFAIEKGARIINYSGGGPEYNEEEFRALKRAEEKGILVVAAAGNEHSDTDQERNYYYPAAYTLKGLTNIITVASIDSDKQLLKSSNWGQKTVDVAAPGQNILSTLPHAQYGKMSGTSQATAFVSGLAALLLSEDRSLTPSEIRESILKTVDREKPLMRKVASDGRINASRAVQWVLSRTKKKRTPAKPLKVLTKSARSSTSSG